MTQGQRRHVVQRPDGQWADEAEGAQRAGGLYPTQAEAQAAATERLKNRPGAARSLYMDGTARFETRTRSTGLTRSRLAAEVQQPKIAERLRAPETQLARLDPGTV